MPTAIVKYNYSSKGGNPTSIGVITVPFSSKKPTDSAIIALITKRYPNRKNIAIKEIRIK